MSTLEELKKMWQQKEVAAVDAAMYTQASLEKIIRSRVKKNMKNSLNYFWASFVLQVIVYSLLSYVIVKYWQNTRVLYIATAGIVLYLPFTFMLLRKFKKLVTEKPLQQKNIGISLYNYVFRQQALLRNFYSFKKRYELFLIPLCCAIGALLVFELYVPGGVREHAWGTVVTFLISLACCAAAIYSENKRSFLLPIRQLQNILDEFEQDS